MSAPRVLVIDGNVAETRRLQVAAVGYDPGTGYARVLQRLQTDLQCEVVYAADADAAPPPGASLASYDGVAITGSALCVSDGGPAVSRQLELVSAVFDAGVPLFGSCWGLQVAVTVAGGAVAANPRGREFGFAHRVLLSEAGREHRLFAGKPSVFEAPTVHRDYIARLPEGAVPLASNEMGVQAAAFSFRRGTAWGVQYHPEYDYRDIAAVAGRYGSLLIEMGLFKDTAALADFMADLHTLQTAPGESALLWKYGLGPAMRDPLIRLAELRNWLAAQVLPRHEARR
ncbi:MAG TPA: type 1 glutamine amidotransferase [Steroidobacteraceae bacterium]|nr:type 1 glutamine amidotransferase [Steroidobacteraceae bacterium]